MPIYELECRKCGERFTRMVPMAERNRQICPSCGEGEAKQRISGFAVGKGGPATHCEGGACDTGMCPGAAGCGGACGGDWD